MIGIAARKHRAHTISVPRQITETVNSLLRARFAQVDFDQARSDVLPFIRDPDAVALWGEGFFVGLLERLRSG